MAKCFHFGIILQRIFGTQPKIITDMKKTTFFIAGICALAALSAFTLLRPASAPAPAKLQWYTWEQAMELQKKAPRKIMVDVYTDWCGWCKRMDATTFADSITAAYIAANFYPIKFDAEQKSDITFGGQTFKYKGEPGRRGTHELAIAILDGKMGYPSIVYFNEKMERIMISPGYKQPADIQKELKFAAEEKYKDTTWEKYRDGK